MLWRKYPIKHLGKCFFAFSSPSFKEWWCRNRSEYPSKNLANCLLSLFFFCFPWKLGYRYDKKEAFTEVIKCSIQCFFKCFKIYAYLSLYSILMLYCQSSRDQSWNVNCPFGSLFLHHAKRLQKIVGSAGM